MFNLTLLISAVATAMVYVLSAYGLVVTYRVAGVFNFALGFQAAFAAFLYWQLDVQWGINSVLAALIVIFAAGPIFGAAVQRILFRRRRDVLTAIIVTLGLGVFLDGGIELFWSGATQAQTVPPVFGSSYWHVDGAVVSANEIGIIVAAMVIGVLVYLLTNHSSLGMRMRAVVDDAELAGASGIPYARMSSVAWVIGSVLAAASGVLLAPLVNLNVSLLAELVVDAFAVATFAGLASLPMVVFGSLILAYLQTLADRFPSTFPFSLASVGASEVLPFILLVIVLLVHPAARRTVRVVAGGMQRQLRARASGNVSVALVLVILLTVVAEMLNSSWAFTGEQVACYALASLSLVLLVGASGQISLCQVTFMGLGAIMLGKLTGAGVPWGVAVIAAMLTSAIAGILVALTAFRLRGLFLALVTYAFAYAALVLIFQNDSIISFAGLSINRPDFIGVNMNNDKYFLVFVVAFLIVAIIIVGAVLRGPWGRALQTLGAGDSIASVSGLGVRGWKATVFTVSAGIAGLSGALLATSDLTVTSTSFNPEQSIFILVYALVGGITTPAGAVVAGVIAGAGTPILGLVLPNPGGWSLVLFGFMAMNTALQYPVGLGGLLPSTFSGVFSGLHRSRRADESQIEQRPALPVSDGA